MCGGPYGVGTLPVTAVDLNDNVVLSYLCVPTDLVIPYSCNSSVQSSFGVMIRMDSSRLFGAYKFGVCMTVHH